MAQLQLPATLRPKSLPPHFTFFANHPGREDPPPLGEASGVAAAPVHDDSAWSLGAAASLPRRPRDVCLLRRAGRTENSPATAAALGAALAFTAAVAPGAPAVSSTAGAAGASESAEVAGAGRGRPARRGEFCSLLSRDVISARVWPISASRSRPWSESLGPFSPQSRVRSPSRLTALPPFAPPSDGPLLSSAAGCCCSGLGRTGCRVPATTATAAAAAAAAAACGSEAPPAAVQAVLAACDAVAAIRIAAARAAKRAASGRPMAAARAA